MPSEIVPSMRELISRSRGFWLVVTGMSMAPTLKHVQDRVYISPLKGTARKGDILLTMAGGDSCLLHRVSRCDGDRLYYKGDALRVGEGPFPAGDVIGIVTRIERNGRAVQVNNIYKLWSLVWLKVFKIKTLFIRALRKPGRLLFHKMIEN